MTHALVTGGGGFLGRYIVQQLIERGNRVRSFARGNYPELKKLGVEVVRGDLANRRSIENACAGIDCVFHTAALPGVSLQREPFQRANVVGTENLLAACRVHEVPRLVFTSSPSVTFAGEDQQGVDESVPLAFEWLEHHQAYYSLTKAISEQAVLAANSPGLATCALRPHLIWGPGDRHLIPRLIARARSGRLRRIGDGTNRVDMIYVENAATAHLQAADALAAPDSPVAGKAYFLSQGEPVNCWQWIDEILRLVDLPPVKKTLSARTAWRIGAVCETAYRLLRVGSEPPMTRFLAAQLATSHWFDIGAARCDFGYTPQVSTAEGMERLGKWLRHPD